MGLFQDKSLQNRIEEAVKLLQDNGYSVLKLSYVDETKIASLKSLVEFFYSFLQFNNPDRKIHVSKSYKRDVKYAKDLVNARINTGISRKRAFSESVLIIKCIILNEPLFKLNYPIHSMECLGQDKMKWVTDKAISIVNNEDEEAKEYELRLYEKSLNKVQEKEVYYNIDDRINKLKSIQSKLGVLDAEKTD